MAAAGGVLYVTTGFGEVFALDPRSGGTIWQRDARGADPRGARWSPTAGSSRCSATTSPTRSTPRTGETLWRVQGVGGTGLLGGASPAADGPARRRALRLGRGAGRAGAQRADGLGHGGHRRAARARAQPDQRHQRRPGDRRRHRLRLEPERAHGPARHARPASGPGRSPRAPTARPGRSAARSSCCPTSARWSGSTPRPARSSGACSCPSSSRTAASSAAASRMRRSPTTGRSWPAGGSGWRAPTGCCAPSARSTARCSRRSPLPGGAAAAPAVAGGVMYVATRDGRLLAFQ